VPTNPSLLLALALCWAVPAAAQPAPTPAPIPAPPDDATDQPPKPAYTPTPAPPAPTWQPKQTATLQALDKLNGQTATLSIPVGQTEAWRDTTIAVKACYARPPDQPQDSTALLTVQTADSPTPAFTGWMLQAEPAASMMQHPVYDIRLLGCT
jgi:hypothetical protein